MPDNEKFVCCFLVFFFTFSFNRPEKKSLLDSSTNASTKHNPIATTNACVWASEHFIFVLFRRFILTWEAQTDHVVSVALHLQLTQTLHMFFFRLFFYSVRSLRRRDKALALTKKRFFKFQPITPNTKAPNEIDIRVQFKSIRCSFNTQDSFSLKKKKTFFFWFTQQLSIVKWQSIITLCMNNKFQHL